MFADILHFTQLEDFGVPATTITPSTGAGGNLGATWNYGASDTNDFGALGDAATAHKTAHSGGVGAFGVYGVDDSNYDATAAKSSLITPCTIQTLKPRTPILLQTLPRPDRPPLGCLMSLDLCSLTCFGRPLRNRNPLNPQPQIRKQARAPPAPSAAANQLESAPA